MAGEHVEIVVAAAAQYLAGRIVGHRPGEVVAVAAEIVAKRDEPRAAVIEVARRRYAASGERAPPAERVVAVVGPKLVTVPVFPEPVIGGSRSSAARSFGLREDQK